MGQFTQEDPIGLGGGLNAYGFAAGDRVNFSDPMGLCPPCGIEIGAGVFGPQGYSKYQFAESMERMHERAKAMVLGFTGPMAVEGEGVSALGKIANDLTERYGKPLIRALESGASQLEFDIGKGTKMVLRGPEPHPLTPGGEPVEHFNIEVHEPNGRGNFDVKVFDRFAT